jgi:hypothetical protein
MLKFITIAGAVAGLAATALFLSFLLSYPVMVLWNECLVGALDGAHQITWMQAWGISALCSILFQSNVSVASK